MKMNSIFGKTGLGVAALSLLLVVGCSKSAENLAVVNGEAITEEEFHSYLKVKPEVQVIVGNGQIVSARVAETIGFQALQDLVRQRMVIQLAKDMKVEPTEKDVLAEVEFQRKRNANFVKDLLAQGLTLDQIKRSLKVDLAREKLLTRSITITTAEVEKFIKENPNQFIQPALVDSRWIFVKDDRGRRDVDRSLQSGAKFETVAVKFSQAPQASQNGGVFPQRVVSSIGAAPIRDILNNTPPGKESEWVKLTDGWAKFFVEERTAEKKLDITETDRLWLRRQLAVQRGLQSNDLDKRLLDKLKTSKIDISMRELKAPWETAMERLKEAAEDANKVKSPTDEASPTATTGGATGTPAAPTGN